jgi:hypothetical protein
MMLHVVMMGAFMHSVVAAKFVCLAKKYHFYLLKSPCLYKVVECIELSLSSVSVPCPSVLNCLPLDVSDVNGYLPKKLFINIFLAINQKLTSQPSNTADQHLFFLIKISRLVVSPTCHFANLPFRQSTKTFSMGQKELSCGEECEEVTIGLIVSLCHFITKLLEHIFVMGRKALR